MVREGSLPLRLAAANQEWALDFANDAVESGPAIRVITFVDAIEVAGSAPNANSFGSLDVKERNVWSCGATRN
jgi:hypothetical protein